MVGANGVIINGPYLDRPGLPAGSSRIFASILPIRLTAQRPSRGQHLTFGPSRLLPREASQETLLPRWQIGIIIITGSAKISVQAQSSDGVGPSFSDSLLVSIFMAPGPADLSQDRIQYAREVPVSFIQSLQSLEQQAIIGQSLPERRS